MSFSKFVSVLLFISSLMLLVINKNAVGFFCTIIAAGIYDISGNVKHLIDLIEIDDEEEEGETEDKKE